MGRVASQIRSKLVHVLGLLLVLPPESGKVDYEHEYRFTEDEYELFPGLLIWLVVVPGMQADYVS